VRVDAVSSPPRHPADMWNEPDWEILEATGAQNGTARPPSEAGPVDMSEDTL
jgi:hypothetical protein